MFTIWNWIVVAVIMVLAIICGIFVAIEADTPITGVVIVLIAGIICAIGMGIVGWYHTSTASGIRDMKDYHSELDNGIERDITIYAEDGREIFHYSGKVDIESDHTDNYIKFESEEGKRYIVYYGIQDTVLIVEK